MADGPEDGGIEEFEEEIIRNGGIIVEAEEVLVGDLPVIKVGKESFLKLLKLGSIVVKDEGRAGAYYWLPVCGHVFFGTFVKRGKEK